jgi:hypothetical protein
MYALQTHAVREQYQYSTLYAWPLRCPACVPRIVLGLDASDHKDSSTNDGRDAEGRQLEQSQHSLHLIVFSLDFQPILQQEKQQHHTVAGSLMPKPKAVNTSRQLDRSTYCYSVLMVCSSLHSSLPKKLDAAGLCSLLTAELHCLTRALHVQ